MARIYKYLCNNCNKESEIVSSQHEAPDGWFDGWLVFHDNNAEDFEIEIECCSFPCAIEHIQKVVAKQASTLDGA